MTKKNPAEAAADTVTAGARTTTPPVTGAAASATSVTSATSAPAAVATQSAPAGPPVTYAGSVNGNPATLAIVVKDGRAVAYLCDGKSAEAWLQGSATGGTLELDGPGAASLTGSYGNGVANGTVRATGKEWTFSVKTVAPPSGLYRATANVRNAQLVGGWIILDNGQQVGLVKLGDSTIPAPPLDTATKTATVDGATVTVAALDGSGL